MSLENENVFVSDENLVQAVSEIKGYCDEEFASISHEHSASDITSGTLAVANGGTGKSSLAEARAELGSVPLGSVTSSNTDSSTYKKFNVSLSGFSLYDGAHIFVKTSVAQTVTYSDGIELDVNGTGGKRVYIYGSPTSTSNPITWSESAIHEFVCGTASNQFVWHYLGNNIDGPIGLEGKADSATTLAGYGITDALSSSLKGANSGLAELDSSGKVPSSQLPSYVDDVLEYSSSSSFPESGEAGKIYVDIASNVTYRWSGSAYVAIGSDLALGETSSTAYRGDRGAAAYIHAVTNKGSAFESGMYKITTNSEGHVTDATAIAKADITGLGIPGSDTTYSEAVASSSGVGGSSGLMSATDKEKLDGIASGAQVNSVTGVKGNSESSYRTGNVNLTYTNLGTNSVSTGGTGKTNSDEARAYLGSIPLGTCDTGASYYPKSVTLPGFELYAGARIAVKFDYTNENNGVALSVNSTGTKYVYKDGARTSSSNFLTWNAGDICEFLYDGAQWQYLGNIYDNYLLLSGGTLRGDLMLGYQSGADRWDTSITVNSTYQLTNTPTPGTTITAKYTAWTGGWASEGLEETSMFTAGTASSDGVFSYDGDDTLTFLAVPSGYDYVMDLRVAYLYESYDINASGEVTAHDSSGVAHNLTDKANNTTMTGATSSANGTAGLVPAPSSSGYDTKFLRADGTWAVPSGSGGYPLFIWSTAPTSSSTYPTSPCFVYCTADNGLYYCTN